jgi:2-polyprenyl-6-methoxyphenol hydroxylase-like FAD-dependent oxidoreductase
MPREPASQTRSAQVLVVGAGPAGAATALLLARGGVAVTLVERETDFHRVFRGEGLMPTGLEALYQMGLQRKLDSLPCRYLESWEIFLDKRRIMSISEPSAELGALALRVIPQPQLLQLLIAEARAFPHFTFMSGVAVHDVLQDNARVRGVRVRTENGEAELAADLVIGCDGRASLLRQRADLALDLLPEAYDILWLKVPLPPFLVGRCPVLIYASGPEVALAYVSWDARLQIAWMLPRGSWPELSKREWWGELTRLFPEDLEVHLRAHREQVEGPTRLAVVVGRCPSWHAPGLLLLGDAAHPMSPVRAQGINMALRDAVVAANHLVPVFRAGRRLEAALDDIQRERAREIVRIQALQLREVRGQQWARERPWLVKPLLWVVPLLAKTGVFQRAWLRQQRELRFGVTEVRLQV